MTHTSTSELRKRGLITGSWTWVHNLADKSVALVKTAFIKAIYKSQAVVGQPTIQQACATGDQQAVLQALTPAMDEFQGALNDVVEPLEDLYRDAGRGGVDEVAKNLTTSIGIRFDVTDPNAVAFLRGYDGALIREMTQQQRAVIIDVVRNAFEKQQTPWQMAKDIRSLRTFGLTQRQAQAVTNYSSALSEAGMKQTTVERLTATYEQRMLKYRSEMIARTETIRASEAGRLAGWKQAARKGLIDEAETRRKWIVTPDDRLCEYCRGVGELNSKGIPFDGQFVTPDGYSIVAPPAHPHCRCSVGLLFD